MCAAWSMPGAHSDSLAAAETPRAADPRDAVPAPRRGRPAPSRIVSCPGIERGKVGAGRSHPHSRHRTENQDAPSAQPPSRPTPFLPKGDVTAGPELERELGENLAMARLPPVLMPQSAAIGIPAHRSTWRAVRPRVCVPVQRAPCGYQRAGSAYALSGHRTAPRRAATCGWQRHKSSRRT